MDGLELKIALINYEDGNVLEAIRLLNKIIDKCLKNDNLFCRDPFWKILAKQVFCAVVLNEFYNKREINNNDLLVMFSDFESIKLKVKEFCLNFGGVNSINFIPYLRGSSDKMIESAISIINDNIINYLQ